MGYSLTMVPFLTEDVTIIPHTATNAAHIGRRVSIRKFAKRRPVSLWQRDDNKEYVAKTTGGEFMAGPLAK